MGPLKQHRPWMRQFPRGMMIQLQAAPLVRHLPNELLLLPHTNLTPPSTRIFKFVDFTSESKNPSVPGPSLPPPPQSY